MTTTTTLTEHNGANCDETVFTPDGPVVGRKTIAANGQQVYTFQGIPYAQAPTGNYRFQYPIKVKSWADLAKNASSYYQDACLQKDTLSAIGTEDCLRISIFTIDRDDEKLLPVFVWIHTHHSKGGISEVSPESGYKNNIAARGIVAVTFNFRVGVMALNETINLGFKDQQMALQWIKENIEYFGGDPARVTLAGSGSGAEFVLVHMKDKASSGLFSAAILQSGQYARERFMSCLAIEQLKKRIGCHEKDLQCLNRKSSNDLLDASEDLNFVPCINHFKVNDPIVNKVPVLIGVNKDESASDEIFRILYKKSEIANFNETDFIKKLNHTAEALAMENDWAYTHTRRLLLRNYFENPPKLPETWFSRFVKMTTESEYEGPMLQVIKRLEGVNVYAYLFSHYSDAEMIGLPWKGVLHGSELQYLFSQPGISIRKDLSFSPTTSDLNMVNTMGALWANFIKYRDPTPERKKFRWIKVASPRTFENGSLNHVILKPSPVQLSHLTSDTVTVWVGELRDYMDAQKKI
ncbi:unnamed protein product [Enterobius vermicularis]|uniref:COesterase domain-containing protein n=1 Tax=Enterobius vermicularis TaxID=51028 RepID=A0A0N4V396_ENTVE|nr:unnamed protein product [Enterobius vermicularis]